jgi:hypothetical protein
MVEEVGVYAPAEVDLSVVSLRERLGVMRVAHEGVMVAVAALAEARRVRNGLLYGHGGGMMDVAMRVREYVGAVFGKGSVEYGWVRGIRFHNDRR